MTIALAPEQLHWLEQAVAEGRFASVEDAVRMAVVTLMTEFDDLLG
jgi:Arc/MetJ-type ribon-helix-helix transcriptional regulator